MPQGLKCCLLRSMAVKKVVWIMGYIDWVAYSEKSGERSQVLG